MISFDPDSGVPQCADGESKTEPPAFRHASGMDLQEKAGDNCSGRFLQNRT
jgi:hypothetical protein